MSPALAFPNLGAEEARDRSVAAERAIAPLAELFRSHVEREPPVFTWLPRDDVCVAWLNTREAAEWARARGRPLYGAPPDVVRRCHDKVFARRAALQLGLEPEPIARHTAVFEPAELWDANELIERIECIWADSGASQGMTLKPRLGTSGRGRVALRGSGDRPALQRALPRLRAAGGAILEPWLERRLDLAVWLVVEPGGEVEVTGSAELLVTRAGVYRGHRGRLDRDGRITSGTPFDCEMRRAARAVVRVASEAGYRGPCGVDGFVYRDGEHDRLRPVAELNARFTLGLLVAACLGEQRDWVERSVPGHDSVAFRCEMGAAPRVAAPEVALRPLCDLPTDPRRRSTRPWLAVATREDLLEELG